MSTDEPNIGTKSGYHHGDLRAQLLEAVRQLIESKGNTDFSISEASRLAGVSSGAPYKHFKDKPAILKAVILEAMHRKADRMRRAMQGIPQGSLERINAIGKAYIDFAREEPGIFRLVFGLTDDHAGDEDLLQAGRETLGIVVKEVAEYLSLPADHPDVMRRAYMLWSFVHGHSFLIIDGKAAMQETPIEEHLLLSDISKSVLGKS